MSAEREERALIYGKLTLGRPRTDRPGEYHGTVEPPPDYLTDEQLAMFNETRPDRYAEHDGQTLEQARNLSIRTFQDTCQFEGVGVPAAEDILAEMNLRRGGSE